MSNSAGNNLINYCTYLGVQLFSAPEKIIAPQKQDAPLFVSGAFRSGTTITTQLLAKSGYDLAPESHLLQGAGPYRHLNPDGFLEDYFFMQLSLYLFHKLNAWGDRPPLPEDVAGLSEEKLSNAEFRKYALMEIHDDRVRNLNKLKVLRKASVNHIRAYVSHVYGAKPLIKNPHFSLLEPFFIRLFPDSKRVVVFRHPADWKRSATALTEKADAKLYDAYYSYYLQETKNIIFFDLDRLTEAPAHSITELLRAATGTSSDVDSLLPLLRTSVSGQGAVSSADDTTSYLQLKALAVNR